MDNALLLSGQISSLSAKIVGALFLAYVYWKHKRKPALWWSLSWVAAAFSILSDITGNIYILSLSEALWASFLFYGTIVLMEEEGIANEKVKLLSAIPVIVSLYGALVDVLGLSSDWFALVGLSYAVSAFLMVISGLLIISLKTFYNKKALYLGSAVTLHGLHELDYPILRLVEWFAPIGFTLGAILALLVAYFMIRFVFTEQFIKGIKKPSVEVHFKPGAMMPMPEEYTTIKEKLEKIPVLGFVRDLNTPESWNVFFITSIEGRNSISPTNLARITDITVRYLKEAKEKGFGGTVVVDCPEYLKTYNGFEAIVKFLSALKDFALFYGGVLILVIDEGAWEERELVTLKRVLT